MAWRAMRDHETRGSPLDPPGRRPRAECAACNGWQFWFAQKGGELVPIDLYRQQLRAELK
jgi:hypothetical protein